METSLLDVWPLFFSRFTVFVLTLGPRLTPKHTTAIPHPISSIKKNSFRILWTNFVDVTFKLRTFSCVKENTKSLHGSPSGYLWLCLNTLLQQIKKYKSIFLKVFIIGGLWIRQGLSHWKKLFQFYVTFRGIFLENIIYF